MTVNAQLNRIIETLEDIVDVSPVDMTRVENLLKEAVWLNKNTDFCLRVCEIMLRNNECRKMLPGWLNHAVAAARDWRHQYCIVGFVERLGFDRDVIETFFTLRPWLSDMGLNMDHDFATGPDAPERLLLVCPEGLCDNNLQSHEIIKVGSLDELLNTSAVDPMNSNVAVYLKPGTYRGGLFCGPTFARIVGLGGRDKTQIELGADERVLVDTYCLTIEGVTIRRVGGDGAATPAVECRGFAALHLRDCEVSNPEGAAIESTGRLGAEMHIQGCRIAGSARGVDASSHYVEIEDSCFEGICDLAVRRRGGERFRVERCCFMPGAGCDFVADGSKTTGLTLRDLVFVHDGDDDRAAATIGINLDDTDSNIEFGIDNIWSVPKSGLSDEPDSGGPREAEAIIGRLRGLGVITETGKRS